jgi:hypothetical protein
MAKSVPKFSDISALAGIIADMVGRIKISSQADGVRHLFMALEQDAKKIKECWFCGSKLPQMKRANQGHMTGNHSSSCTLEELARACERCIMVREDDDETMQAAENILAESIDDLFDMMEDVRCPFPICNYLPGRHRLECRFSSLERSQRRSLY